MDTIDYCRRVSEAIDRADPPPFEWGRWFRDRREAHTAAIAALEGDDDAALRQARGVADRWELDL